ncbi:MAG: class I SAM-dependent methyltransferase, partial [Candidatus Omnitrophota bacterium]|nr:class I SAM-dependent methyltransferase [Candidatus Omnitrophota bacterium]
MDACRLCGEKSAIMLLDMGAHPIAHRYLTDSFQQEYVHPIVLMFCKHCGHFQLDNPIPADLLYENYICLSSWKYQPHIPSLIRMIKNISGLKKTAKVLEVGSNDGIFLKALMDEGYSDVIGIEPAQDAQASAKKIGVRTIPGYFDARTAQEFVAVNGNCDFFISRQMLEHINDLEKFIEAMRMVIKPGGYVLIEVPNFMTNLDTYDYTLWEEHINYFTLGSLNYFLAKAGVRIIHSETIVFSGDNIVVIGQYVGYSLPDMPLDYVGLLLAKALSYKDKWPSLRCLFNDFLKGQRERGKKIAIYGAGARLCSFVNFYVIGSNIEFVLDDQVEKQGKFLPGSKLPIVPGAFLEQRKIDLCLLGVNYECEEKVIAKHPD